jgi:pyrroloquinoline-quinone synthase
MKNNNWWSRVEELLAEKSLLKHPFYQAWTMGTLTREDLALYARQYYQQESRFPGFVESVLQRCSDQAARKALEENLADERGGHKQPSHPELWLRFAEAVGASRQSVLFAEPTPETSSCVETFGALTSDSPAAGLSALYAYEAQQPAVAAAKISGLIEKYDLSSDEALGFFRVHQDADAWHSENEEQALLRAVESGQASADEVVASVGKACDALNTLLDGVWAGCEARKLAAC